MTEKGTLIIGIGNRYRGDDAFGCLIAADLAEQCGSGVACIEHDGEPAGLIDCWQGASRVILIDAVSSGAKAGHVFRFDLAKQELPEDFNLYSTHAFGIPQAVELARALGKLPPEISFIGIEGADFDAGQSLSPLLEAARPDIVDEILTSLISKETSHA